MRDTARFGWRAERKMQAAWWSLWSVNHRFKFGSLQEWRKMTLFDGRRSSAVYLVTLTHRSIYLSIFLSIYIYTDTCTQCTPNLALLITTSRRMNFDQFRPSQRVRKYIRKKNKRKRGRRKKKFQRKKKRRKKYSLSMSLLPKWIWFFFVCGNIKMMTKWATIIHVRLEIC